MEHRSVFSALLACCAVYLPVQAQTIYKCGGNSYTDHPCAGGKVVGQISPEEVARSHRIRDAEIMLGDMRVGNFQAARTLAATEGEEAQYNWALVKYRRQAAWEQNQAQQQQYEQQQRMISGIRNMQAENSSLKARNEQYQEQLEENAQVQRNQPAAQQAQDMAPKFNPQTGQWCQTLGGTVECH